MVGGDEPRSSLVEGDEGSYRPNLSNKFVYCLHELSLYFPFLLTEQQDHLGRYDIHLLLLKAPYMIEMFNSLNAAIAMASSATTSWP